MLAPTLTILLSSFLLFLVQPILAKQILPWFGGSAGVWTVCLVFFQVLLLLGYAYAHWLTRRGLRSRQFLLHIALLLISCLALPIVPSVSWKPGPDTEPTLRILGLLVATIGLPYFLIASTAPLLQRWLSASSNTPNKNKSIYRLFALSNFGSLIGLLSYPFAIEPFSTVHFQELVWSWGYGLYVICLISYAWKRSKLPNDDPASQQQGASLEPPPSIGRYAYWIMCAALGSGLLLSVTNQLTQNVAPIPFLWIAPLVAYLLSFIICFEGRAGRGWYERRFWIAPAMLACAAMAWALFSDKANLSIYSALPIFIVGLFFGCVICHGELARSKPSPAYLTHFYLCLAAGGALGGLLVGLLAPQIFNNYWEAPAALVMLAVLGVYGMSEQINELPRTSWTANIAIAVLATALILLLLGALPSAWDRYTLDWAKILKGDARWGCAALLVLSIFLLHKYRLSRAIALTALFCTLAFDLSYYQGQSKGTILSARSFYGTLRVIDSSYGGGQIRELTHGVILHGSQVMQPPLREMPTTYYGQTSGIGHAILSRHRTSGPLRIGSVGLGVGTLAWYGKPGDLFRVYELNPTVLQIARNQFFYLRESGAKVEPVIGDARLSLEFAVARGDFDKPEQRFDILSLDAFSGDGIPVHLLTREAFATYARVVKPDGIIAFHLSNAYLNLPPVVEQVARNAGFTAVLVADRPTAATASNLSAPSDWVLATRDGAFFNQSDIAPYITQITARSGLPEWTDQFSNLFQILK
jgi:SAM-dependent methyltransferase